MYLSSNIYKFQNKDMYFINKQKGRLKPPCYKLFCVIR